MKKHVFWQSGAIITMILLFSSCKKNLPCDCTGSETGTMKVFATGLNNPRGLKFGPDGNLYVAEGGIGGMDSSTGKCDPVIPPVGPYKGSTTGSGISKIDPTGHRSTVSDKFPSSVNALGDVSGVGDVAFMGNDLYAVITGAGCSHGVPSIPNGLAKVNPDGSWTPVADLSAFLRSHPVQHPEEDDFEPDGDWYSLYNIGNTFYTIEANHGELDQISTSGAVKRILDISSVYGHIVPTALTFRDGYFYVGNLNPFPIVDGSSNVYRISYSGDIDIYSKKFSTILGLTFDEKGRLYVLENTVGKPFPTPGSGKVIRVDLDGSKHEIISGLSLPTAITYGPDKKLYVSNIGFGPESIGGGQVVQITLNDCNCNCDLSGKFPIK